MLQIKHKRTLLFAIISLVFLTSVKGQKESIMSFIRTSLYMLISCSAS